jgi:hypothetical protein
MCSFYMLRIGLVAYIFHEMDERSKGVSMIEEERNEDQEEISKSDASSSKEIKKREG